MFLDPSHERTFYDNLEAYSKEFGAERVIVIFPRRWPRIDPDKFKPMKLQSWEMAAVGLRVTNGSAHYTLPVSV